MKTKTRSKRKEAKDKKTGAIVRDLMKPIYMFGRHDAPDTFVTDLAVALTKLDAGESFYLRVGDKVYHVATQLYRSMGTPKEKVAERMREVCWDSLAERVESAWQSDKSAVEVLSEMRR